MPLHTFLPLGRCSQKRNSVLELPGLKRHVRFRKMYLQVRTFFVSRNWNVWRTNSLGKFEEENGSKDGSYFFILLTIEKRKLLIAVWNRFGIQWLILKVRRNPLELDVLSQNLSSYDLQEPQAQERLLIPRGQHKLFEINPTNTQVSWPRSPMTPALWTWPRVNRSVPLAQPRLLIKWILLSHPQRAVQGPQRFLSSKPFS